MSTILAKWGDAMSRFDAFKGRDFDVIVIGSGFGASVAVTTLVEKSGRKLRILVVERGTWWGNPEGPGLAPAQPPPTRRLVGTDEAQQWPRPNDSRGVLYVLQSIYKELHPVADFLDWRVADNDLGTHPNRRGLYRLTRFSHANGNVDVVSSNGVGGGSLIYSGVNLIPPQPVLSRIGLSHLTTKRFQLAGGWNKKYRGVISKIHTKVPLPAAAGAPDPARFQLSAIPESGDAPAAVDYETADPAPLGADDDDFLYLDRARVLKRAKARVEATGGFVVEGRAATTGEFRPLPLSVVELGTPEAAKKHTFCSREGRCINGCLPGARHTLYKTIETQVDQKGHTLDLLPQTKVLHVTRAADDRYVVELQCFLDDEGGERGNVSAPVVILGAGCLGSTEILLRSRTEHRNTAGREGLPLGDTIGKKFSTNGDFFAFVKGVNDNDKVGVPDAQRIGKPNPTVGPINSSGFHLAFAEAAGRPRVDVHVEDAGIPPMFARLIHELMPALDGDLRQIAIIARAFVRALMSNDPFNRAEVPDPQKRDQEQYQTERELVGDMFFFNAMGAGPDEPFGTFYLDDNVSRTMNLRFDAPLHRWHVFRHVEAVLAMLSQGMGGTPVPSPFWNAAEKRITVTHPLGGCAIGPDRDRGAIDARGRVFDGSGGAAATAVLEGLYVVDASAIPGALGVNPTFTIVAQALYAMEDVLAYLAPPGA